MIYYCKDTENACFPNTIVSADTLITSYNTISGVYYIRYRMVENNISSTIGSYTAKVDVTDPTCTVTKTATGVDGVNVTINCTDNESGCSGFTENNLKENKTFTVTNGASRTGTCNVTISTQNINCRNCYYGENTCSYGCDERWDSCYYGSYNECVGGNERVEDCKQSYVCDPPCINEHGGLDMGACCNWEDECTYHWEYNDCLSRENTCVGEWVDYNCSNCYYGENTCEYGCDTSYY